MEYILIGICLISAVYLVKLLFKKTDQKNKDSFTNTKGSVVISPTNEEPYSNHLVIQMEMLPAEYEIDERNLAEITDSKVLAHVNNLVPGLAQVGNAANNVAKAVQANRPSVHITP